MDTRLSSPRPFEEKLQPDKGLARSRRPLDDGRTCPRHSAAEHVVEPSDPGRYAVGGRNRRNAAGLGAPHSRKEGKPIGTDLEEVTATDLIRSTELEDLDHPDRCELLTPDPEADDTVSDSELGMGLDLFVGVFADEEAGCSPACRMDREIIHEGPGGRGIAEDVPDRLEAVDDDDHRLLLLDPTDNRLEDGVGVPAPDHGAEVREDELLTHQTLVEERELLHVLDELQRRLGQGREVEAFLALPSEVEQHLQRKQRFAGAGLSGDHAERPDGQPSTEELIEGGAACRKAL